MGALADQIEDVLGTAIPDLQVRPVLEPNPTPPCIDIYPASPFQERTAYGTGNNDLFFTVRARVNMADNEAGQLVLLALADPDADTSLEQAVMSDQTLSGEVGTLNVEEGPSEYGQFQDVTGQFAWLGCTWRVRVIP